MPAETHQLSEPLDAGTVTELIATIVGIDPAEAPGLPLAELGLDDDLSIFALWDAVVEEYGERSVGADELVLDEDRPATLGELAQLFAGALRP